MSDTIQIKRGNYANLPVLADGELALTEDLKRLYIGTATGNTSFPIMSDLKPLSLYAVCNTASESSSKTVSANGFTLLTGLMINILFTYACPANSTLNIEGTGAISMRLNGSVILSSDIPAGALVTFVYNGTYYDIITINTYSLSITGSGFIKFSDGTMICYVSTPLTVTSTAFGSSYLSTQQTLNFPLAFTAVPYVSGYTLKSGNGAVLGSQYGDITTTHIINIFISGTVADASAIATYQLVGRWK